MRRSIDAPNGRRRVVTTAHEAVTFDTVGLTMPMAAIHEDSDLEGVVI